VISYLALVGVIGSWALGIAVGFVGHLIRQRRAAICLALAIPAIAMLLLGGSIVDAVLIAAFCGVLPYTLGDEVGRRLRGPRRRNGLGCG
jgi:uncharacterized membrane protein YjjB (DUF3815 family)